MKKFGCNRLYMNVNRYVSQSVVTISDVGGVDGYSPLVEETASTEWIGGVIFLSDKDVLESTSSFKALTQDITDTGCPTYAWHISNFDFQQEELTSDSIIRRL